jgi:hypothetical protein
MADENKAIPFAPAPSPVAQSAKQFALRTQDKKTVTMVFPRAVLLTLQDASRILFPEGTNEVPLSLVDHFYLKAHGVTKYEAKATSKKDSSQDSDTGNSGNGKDKDK